MFPPRQLLPDAIRLGDDLPAATSAITPVQTKSLIYPAISMHVRNARLPTLQYGSERCQRAGPWAATIETDDREVAAVLLVQAEVGGQRAKLRGAIEPRRRSRFSDPPPARATSSWACTAGSSCAAVASTR